VVGFILKWELRSALEAYAKALESSNEIYVLKEKVAKYNKEWMKYQCKIISDFSCFSDNCIIIANRRKSKKICFFKDYT